MPLAASTYTFGDGLLTVLELAFLFLWIWIAVGVVFDIFRSQDLSNGAKALWILFIFVLPLFGVLGYLFEKLRFPIAPMVLGVILGPLAENAYMQSMLSYHNDWTVFFREGLSGTLMVVSLLAMCYPFVRHQLLQRQRARVARVVRR